MGAEAGDGGLDGAGPADAGPRSSLSDAAIAYLDGGSLRDPSTIIGASGIVDAGDNLVTLLVNAEVIRAHPAGDAVSKIVLALPQWSDFFVGTKVDPVRDIDWVLLFGPALLHTDRDVFTIHYAAADTDVDEAIRSLASRYDKGGPWDAGVRGVKATLGYADRGERVFLRPKQPHVVAVVPVSIAHKQAVGLSRANIPGHLHPGEAASLRVSSPHHALPQYIAQTVSEVRLKVLVRDDGGADVVLEGDCPNAKECEKIAADAKASIASVLPYAGLLLGSAISSALHHIEWTAAKDMVSARVTASMDVISASLAIAGNELHIPLPLPLVVPPGVAGSTAPPSPSAPPEPYRVRVPAPAASH